MLNFAPSPNSYRRRSVGCFLIVCLTAVVPLAAAGPLVPLPLSHLPSHRAPVPVMRRVPAVHPVPALGPAPRASCKPAVPPYLCRRKRTEEVNTPEKVIDGAAATVTFKFIYFELAQIGTGRVTCGGTFKAKSTKNSARPYGPPCMKADFSTLQKCHLALTASHRSVQSAIPKPFLFPKSGERTFDFAIA